MPFVIYVYFLFCDVHAYLWFCHLQATGLATFMFCFVSYKLLLISASSLTNYVYLFADCVQFLFCHFADYAHLMSRRLNGTAVLSFQVRHLHRQKPQHRRWANFSFHSCELVWTSTLKSTCTHTPLQKVCKNVIWIEQVTYLSRFVHTANLQHWCLQVWPSWVVYAAICPCPSSSRITPPVSAPQLHTSWVTGQWDDILTWWHIDSGTPVHFGHLGHLAVQVPDWDR